MTQLIIGVLELPCVKGGGYQCYEESLNEQITMASGRVVEEVRGRVWMVEYAIDTMPDDTYRALRAALRSGAITAHYLPDNGDALETGTFLCTRLPKPRFICEHLTKAIWKDISFTLREVTPHD